MYRKVPPYSCLYFTLCELKADRVASDPRGPLGDGVGAQQFTGSPVIGNGVFT